MAARKGETLSAFGLAMPKICVRLKSFRCGRRQRIKNVGAQVLRSDTYRLGGNREQVDGHVNGGAVNPKGNVLLLHAEGFCHFGLGAEMA